MKRMLILIGVIVGLCQTGRCDSLTDQFVVGLFQHTETVTETTTHGQTYVELLATPFQIGRIDKGYFAGIDGGVLGNVAPQPGDSGFDWTVGIHAHLSPLIKRYIIPNISPDYPAIAGFEINPRISIDFTHDGHKTPVYGLSLGYAWSGVPLQ